MPGAVKADQDKRIMAELHMDHKPETKLQKLLYGRAEGAAVALRGCAPELAATIQAHFGADAPLPLRIFEPCRVEHPHSAFLRKPVEHNGEKAVQTTLYAPGGKLHEERAIDGAALEFYVKKPQDFEVLRGFLKDIELHPGKSSPAAESTASLACLGLTPLRELETRWAGPDMARWAMANADESAASCIRKLERQLHRRAEEACRTGSRACVLRDMAAEPLPETYMLHAGRHIEWLKHAGLMPYVEVAAPTGPLLAALAAACAGVRMPLGLALANGFPELPEDMRLVLDLDAAECIPEPELLKRLLGQCAAVVIVMDCGDAEPDPLTNRLEPLMLAIQNQ